MANFGSWPSNYIYIYILGSWRCGTPIVPDGRQLVEGIMLWGLPSSGAVIWTKHVGVGWFSGRRQQKLISGVVVDSGWTCGLVEVSMRIKRIRSINFDGFILDQVGVPCFPIISVQTELWLWGVTCHRHVITSLTTTQHNQKTKTTQHVTQQNTTEQNRTEHETKQTRVKYTNMLRCLRTKKIKQDCLLSRWFER
jgi:hypothetical protein